MSPTSLIQIALLIKDQDQGTGDAWPGTYDLKKETMTKFIELKISEEDELKTVLVNIASIGRVYASPQSRIKSIVELNYQSINDAPVYLEVEMPYETLRLKFLEE